MVAEESAKEALIQGVAKAVCAGIGTLLRQEYKFRKGAWWLYSLGKPQRVLTDEEVKWHKDRNHFPFCKDGVKPDDPEWWK